jgi:predicted permease
MPRLSTLRRLWRNIVNRNRVERDLDDELRGTFEMLAEEKIEAGMTPEEARRAAMIELGGIEAVKDQVRDVRAGAFLDTFAQDLRYAVRLLARNPLFALTAALSLAIGIGANTTIFTVANGLLFRAPTGVAEPHRLVDIDRTRRGFHFAPIGYDTLLDIRRRTVTLTDVYGHQPVAQPMSLSGPNGAERVFGNYVTSNYFAVLGVNPAAGRLFLPTEDQVPGDSPIVVLSHTLWTRRFNQDPRVVGQIIRISGRSFTVVGIAPEGFQGTSVLYSDLWLPLGMAPIQDGPTSAANAGGSGSGEAGSTAGNANANGSAGGARPRLGVQVMGGRLKPGVTVAQAAAEFDALGRALAADDPGLKNSSLKVIASSPIPGKILPVGPFLALLMAIVSIVLVIACANLAGVLLARATARRREIAVRLAIGAGRGRLVRQLLTETMLLFLLGGAAGLLLARVMTTGLVALLPVLPVPINVSLGLDARIVLFTTGLSLVAALFSGLAPALQASKADVVAALKGDEQGPSDRLRLRSAFVIAQVAFSILLVIAAGLMGRALGKATSIDTGFEARGVELATFNLGLGNYTNETGRVFLDTLADRVRALPGVASVSLAHQVPMGDVVPFPGKVRIPGRTAPDGKSTFDVGGTSISPGYFETMRIPLVAGRDFSASDRDGSQLVAIIGEAAARRFWPGESAIGKQLVLEQAVGMLVLRRPGAPEGVDMPKAGPGKILLMVGVARDLKYHNLREAAPRSFLYVPLQQEYHGEVTLLARGTHGQRLASEIRALVAALDPNLPILASKTLEDNVSLALVPQRVAAAVSGSLGIVGLLLAAIGIYGVMAYAVTRRTREIGIRIALGATRSDVLRLVLRHGLALSLGGAAIGLLLAAFASRLLVTFLFGVPPLDPLIFAGAALLFAAIGLTACYLPARRATRIDATEALRYE